MRSRIKINGEWYRPMPWMEDGECTGCAFDREGCINDSEHGNPCDDGNEFSGMVLIPNNKAAYEEYVVKAVTHKFDASS